jgi:hypothetical protein
MSDEKWEVLAKPQKDGTILISFPDKTVKLTEDEIMKLYEVPRNSRIVLPNGVELNFKHLDGAYSYCTDDEGNVIHISAGSEVTVKEKKDV